jgi:hypothetical protein
MGNVYPLRPASFSPYEVRQILKGFDAACNTLNIATLDGEARTAMRELVAAQAINLAEQGIVDAERLHDRICNTHQRLTA